MGASERIDELRKRYDENQRRFFAPLANEYRKAGDLEQAIALCRLHLADTPANLSGQIVFGQALYDSGNLEEARTTFETAIGLDPENLIALRHLGDIGRAQSDAARAREWYRRVLDADPRNEDVLALIADLAALETVPAPGAEQRAAAAEPSVEVSTLGEGTTPQAAPSVSATGLASAPRSSTVSLIGVDVPTPQFEPATPGSALPVTVGIPALRAKAPEAPEAPTAEGASVPEAPFPSVPMGPTDPAGAEQPEAAAFGAVTFPVYEEQTVEAAAGAGEATAGASGLSDAADAVAAGGPELEVRDVASSEPVESDRTAFESVEFPVVDAVVDATVDTTVDATVDATPPQTDAVDFGNIDAEAHSQLANALPTPESSFGFDVDLAVAADIPVAAGGEETPDFGVVELPDDAPFRDTPEVEQQSAFSETIEIADVESEPAPVSDSQPASLAGEASVAEDVAPAEMERGAVPEQPSTPAAFTFDLTDAEVPSEPAESVNAFPAPETTEPVEELATGSTPDVVAESASEAGDAGVAETFAPPILEPLETTPAEYGPEPQATAPKAADSADWIYETPAPVRPSTPVAPVETFATETMAEVYVRQGLRYEAIAVYRQLVDARPGDTALRARLAELEDERHAAGGSTARAFFANLASLRWPRPSAPHVAPTPTFLLESVPPVDGGEALGTPQPAAPSRGGALGAFFGDPTVSGYDDAAAQTLSSAFGDEPPPIARRSGNAAPPAGTTSPEAGADVEHLKSWLDDLTKP